MTLDIEGVLAGTLSEWQIIGVRAEHDPSCDGDCIDRCPVQVQYEVSTDEATAHVAAVLREQIAAWLGSDAVERGIVQRANAEDDRHFAAGSSHGLGAGEAVSLTLAALAAQVACVDPSRSESGSTDPEVRQSADRTSSPSRVPGEGP